MEMCNKCNPSNITPKRQSQEDWTNEAFSKAEKTLFTEDERNDPEYKSIMHMQGSQLGMSKTQVAKAVADALGFDIEFKAQLINIKDL